MMLRNFKLSNLKLRTKLLAILLVTGLIPLIVFHQYQQVPFYPHPARTLIW